MSAEAEKMLQFVAELKGVVGGTRESGSSPIKRIDSTRGRAARSPHPISVKSNGSLIRKRIDSFRQGYEPVAGWMPECSGYAIDRRGDGQGSSCRPVEMTFLDLRNSGSFPGFLFPS